MKSSHEGLNSNVAGPSRSRSTWEERGGRLAGLDELTTNSKRLERVALDNSTYLDEKMRIHALWSALRAIN